MNEVKKVGLFGLWVISLIVLTIIINDTLHGRTMANWGLSLTPVNQVVGLVISGGAFFYAFGYIMYLLFKGPLRKKGK